ncbi:MAG: hypothetical protein HOB32_05270 [Nitrospina sp.]|nr:hypothetical protein [Nitrospina sp.]
MAQKNNKKANSFPWKAVFGAISIISVLAVFMASNNSKVTEPGSSVASQKSLSGFSLKK